MGNLQLLKSFAGDQELEELRSADLLHAKNLLISFPLDRL